MAPTSHATQDWIEALPWDTEFFGRRIGRARDIPAADLAALASLARDLEFDCTYLFQSPQHVQAGTAEANGFTLVDVQVELVRTTKPIRVTAAPAAATRPGRAEDLPRLGPVITAIAPWSRFAIDERFGLVTAERMYAEWLRRSVRLPDHLCIAAERDFELIGLVTASNPEEPRIGLLGSIEPRAGIGTLLLTAALEWATAHAHTLSVVTQARNISALHFYTAQGFRVANVCYVYHLWT